MGFNLGQPGGPLNTVETKRKHRWIFETLDPGPGRSVLLLLQKASRPSWAPDEVELHHNQEEAWFLGKSKWEPVSMEYYDGEQDPDSSRAMWDWLKASIDIPTANVNAPSAYKADQAELNMVGGFASNVLETWRFRGAWPKAVNWNELDYTASDIMTITVELRYDRAELN